VIAARGGDNAARRLRQRQGEERVDRAARLEGPGYLQRFELEQQTPRGFRVRSCRRRIDHRGSPHEPANPLRRCADLVYSGGEDHGAHPVRNRISKVAGTRPSGSPNLSA
jgi:hypothetical protein